MAKHSMLGINAMKSGAKPASRAGVSSPLGKLKPATVGTLALALAGLLVLAIVIALASSGGDQNPDTAAATEAPDPVNPGDAMPLAMDANLPDLSSIGNTPMRTNNTTGTQKPIQQPAREARMHEIQPGETLGGIASKYYGSSQRFDVIMEANGIEDETKIRAGQTIEIPYLAEGEARSVARPAPSTPRSSPAAANSSAPAAPSGTASRSEAATLLNWDPPASAASADVPAQVHTYSTGDTFFSLAKQYYGDIAYYKMIVDANPGIENIGHLRPGATITIPALKRDRPTTASTAPRSVAPTTVSEEPPVAAQTYVVQSGDSLSTISQKVYGTSKDWKRIADANGISDPRTIRVGQELVIPAR